MTLRWNIHARVDLKWAETLARLRRTAWLRALYKLLPQTLRRRASLALDTRNIGSASFPRLPPVNGARANVTELHPAQSTSRSGGVNIFGYLRGQFGLAESARSYARALMVAGYPVALVDIVLGLQHGLQDSTLETSIGNAAPHNINLIFVNPDYLQPALESIGHERLAGRYTIACWFWELQDIPQQWRWAIDAVDEILVASEFVAQAFRNATQKPVLRVPLPLVPAADSGLTRADFGLPSDKFIFLASFDFHSSVHRKNPRAAIEAFRKAFPADRDDVRLLIKTSNGHLYSEQLHKLLALCLQDPRILLRDQIIEGQHMRALQRCCDAYVSLHRSEGFGLGLAECMAMGKPVVGTAWSGNMEFMTSSNSCLVDYSLIRVADGEYQYGQNMQWAEPSIDNAAAHMSKLVDDEAYRAGISLAAAADARTLLSPDRAAKALIERFDELTDGKNRPLPTANGSSLQPSQELRC